MASFFFMIAQRIGNDKSHAKSSRLPQGMPDVLAEASIAASSSADYIANH
jgi:hypothetical protein